MPKGRPTRKWSAPRTGNRSTANRYSPDSTA